MFQFITLNVQMLLIILCVPSLSYLCSLYIENLERSDAGQYSCHIVNEMGEGTSCQLYALDVYCEFSLEVLL